MNIPLNLYVYQMLYEILKRICKCRILDSTMNTVCFLFVCVCLFVCLLVSVFKCMYAVYNTDYIVCYLTAVGLPVQRPWVYQY